VAKLNKVMFVMARASDIPKLSGRIAVPPAGMLSIVGYARQHFPDIEFILRDFGAEEIAISEQVQVIAAAKPDILCMAARSFIYPATIRLAEAVKAALGDVRIIFGGHHPTLMPEDTSWPDCFDVVVRFEGEKAMVDLLTMHQEGKPWPKTYSARYLDDLSHPYAWDIIKKPEAYARLYSPFNVDPMGSVVWSRGCPFNCVFCSGPALWKGSNPKVRYRSPQSITEELEYINRRFGIRRFFTHDDTLNADLDRLVPILEEIIRRNLKMTWGAAGMRANKALTPPELFPLLRRAGCRYVSYGIESGDAEVLRMIKRRVGFEDIERALSLSRRSKLRTCGGFTLGHIWREADGSLGGETEPQVRKTVDYIRYLTGKRLLWSLQLSVIDPVPGSELWDIAASFDLVPKSRDWDRLLAGDRVELAFKHPHLDARTIERYYQEAYRIVGMSPKHALFLLSTVESWRDFLGLVRTGLFVWRSRLNFM
jgi:anaerobic magnesium-protoporphyrin IX monomethyl ester cyclase